MKASRDSVVRSLINLLGLVVFGAASLAVAHESQVRQSIVLEVSSCGALGVSGNPRPLIIGPGVAAVRSSAAVDGSTELRYASAVRRGSRRVIIAQFENGDSAPAGCVLRLTARPAGGGPEGSSAGEIVLSESPQVLISGIGNCVAGLQPGAGARLYYRLSVENAVLLKSGESKAVTVFFTLMDST